MNSGQQGVEAPERDSRFDQLNDFAQSRQELVPAGPSPLSAPQDRVFGAQKVAVYRDDARVLQKIKALAAAAGTEWFYRFKAGNGWVEGPSIKLANDVARIYGNCEIDTRAFDLGDAWMIYARFTDFETGFSMTRPFQQRKSQRAMKTDPERALDIAFQIGTSKAIRNVIVNALQTYADFGFEEARNSLVEQIGGNLEKWRDKTVTGLANFDVDLNRVEAVMGRAAKDWLAPDIARIISMMKAVKDGMATLDESFPAITTDGEKVDPKTGELQGFAEGDKSTGKKTAAKKKDKPAEQPQPETEQQADKPAETGEKPVTNKQPEAETQADAVQQPEAEKSSPPKAPTNEDEWAAYAREWITKGPGTADDKLKQWADEKKLRNACAVLEEKREELKAVLDATVAELRKAA